VLSVLSYRMAKRQNGRPVKAIFEHVFIALVVVILTHQIGDWISMKF